MYSSLTETYCFQAPPPAALEFLEKIREVIHEAKRKISVKKFIPNLEEIPEHVDEDTDEQLSSCNKCKTQFKIKSATIQKWLMDVPADVAKPKKSQAPGVPVEQKAEVVDGRNDAAPKPEKDDLKPNADGDFNGDDDEDDEEESVNIECDSLERSMNYARKSGYHTPSEYGDVAVRPDLSPVLSSCALPMEEELTVRTTYTYDTVTKRENHYEHISGPDCVRERPRRETLPDVLNRGGSSCSERYSLVSEVYVNDSFCNTIATPNQTLDKKIKNRGPGQITIEVEDSPDNHPAVDDSDSFEPDTLDRHSAKITKPKPMSVYSSDSLEQPLRGPKGLPPPSSNKNAFGSLLEIYEAKTVMADVQKRWNANNHRTGEAAAVDSGYLKPDPKHCRRQRCPSPLSAQNHPKNVRVRSTSGSGVAPTDRVRSPHNRGRTHEHHRVAGASDDRKAMTDSGNYYLPAAAEQNRYEDSGYLSTESNESYGKAVPVSLDTDESGAESMDTDFKFFKTRTERNYCDW